MELLPQISQFVRSSWTRIPTGSVLRKDGEPCFTSRRLAAMRCRSAGLAVSGGSFLPLGGSMREAWELPAAWLLAGQGFYSRRYCTYLSSIMAHPFNSSKVWMNQHHMSRCPLSYRSSNKPPDAQAEEDNDSHRQSQQYPAHIQRWQRIAMQTWCHHTSQPFG